MNYYISKCSELNFLLCIKNGLWAQEKNRMSMWKPKDRLILVTEEGISGLFEVTSKQFIDDSEVWPDKLYRYRVNINPIKVLAPNNRIPITEQNIRDELASLYGRAWGFKIMMLLRPIKMALAKRIEELIEERPHYDPFPTIEDEIRKLSALVGKKPPMPIRKEERRKEKKVAELPLIDEKGLHDSIIHMIADVGRWEGKHSETEYEIGTLGRLDVVWKRIKTGNPSYAFEVQIKGNFYQALTKLKHAFDLWNSTPVLVTTEQFQTQAEELLSGSFHEMRRQAKIVNYEKIQQLFSLEKQLHQLKEEFDL